jgi:hypothetical protein
LHKVEDEAASIVLKQDDFRERFSASSSPADGAQKGGLFS